MPISPPAPPVSHTPEPGREAAAPGSRKGTRALMLQLAVRCGLALVAVPVALAVTLVLFPFWSWVERTTGIESVGHSGPASWCYLAVWVPMAIALVLPPLWRLAQALSRRLHGHADS